MKPMRFMRKWRYDQDVDEFFVEDETTVKIKKSDLTKKTETTEMDDSQLKPLCVCVCVSEILKSKT